MHHFVVMWMSLWQISKNWPSSTYHLVSRLTPTVPSCDQILPGSAKQDLVGCTPMPVTQTSHPQAKVATVVPFQKSKYLDVFGTSGNYCVLLWLQQSTVRMQSRKGLDCAWFRVGNLLATILKLVHMPNALFQQVRTLLIVPL